MSEKIVVDTNLLEHYARVISVPSDHEDFIEVLVDHLSSESTEDIVDIGRALGIDPSDLLGEGTKAPNLSLKRKRSTPSPTYPTPNKPIKNVPMPMIKDRPYRD